MVNLSEHDNDLGDEGFQPDQTLSLADVKIEVETRVETPTIILEVK